MKETIQQLKNEFFGVFGQAPGAMHVVRSPGRVNLIGEHTDYNDGFVFPMAIEPEVRIVCRGRQDGKVRVASTVYPGQIVEFSVQEKIEKGQPQWANYIRGVAAEMIKAGLPLGGMDAYYTNTLPVGGGLSSSAAIEVGTARAFLALGGQDLDLTRMALVCQMAEHHYAGMPCGIMDQTIVASGRVNHAMLLDCRDNSKQFVPIDSNELRVLIVNTMVKHELTEGGYAKRRDQCYEGVAYFKKSNPTVKALRDVTLEQVEAAKNHLDPTVYRRCRHVVGENQRTTDAAKLLNRRDYEKVGQLMYQSHNSLRDDYNVSCPELDYLVEQAAPLKGVYGARMTGGGFGGCIVALVQPRAVEAVMQQLTKAYKARFNIDPVAFVTTATAGATVLE